MGNIYKYLIVLFLIIFISQMNHFEKYTDYPGSIKDVINIELYKNTNKDILDQSKIFISRGYRMNNDMYSLDYGIDYCNPKGVPISYYNKKNN